MPGEEDGKGREEGVRRRWGALLLSSSLQNMEVDLRIVFSLLLRRLLNESAASRRMGDNAKHMSASSLLQV